MQTVLDNTAIAGIGFTEFSKNSGRSELQLAVESGRAAMEDAGMEPSDIDGMVTFTLDTSEEMQVQHCLGIPELRWTSRTPFGGAGSGATVQLAAAAVASGAAKAVLIYRAFNERSGKRFGQPGFRPTTTPAQNMHASYGLLTPAQIYALWFQPYMRKYNVTNEDLGHYTVLARKHAATNPQAWFYQRPITLQDHQNSRWIVEPVFRLLDCCQESDGGTAIIVTSVERARDLKQKPVKIVAAAQSHLMGGDIMFNFYRGDLIRHEEAFTMSKQLWDASGLRPSDMDVAILYENFTPVVLMSLEGHGFCKLGEAKDFIKDGNLEMDGMLPTNTNGGLLGEGYIHGMNNIQEGVRQVRGTAANQVDKVQFAYVGGGRSGMILGHV